MKVGVISLGCDKNRADVEHLLGFVVRAGHEIVNKVEDADAVIVNTCAFLQSAIKESLDAVFEARACATVKYVIVAGCLPLRYLEDLRAEEGLPEADAFIDNTAYDRIGEILDRLVAGEKVVLIGNGEEKRVQDRVLTTPYSYAYLKIADGCDNRCTFCAIPSIRGPYKSRSVEDLVEEAKELALQGVKELILVAQDVTRYGIDLYGEEKLLDLLHALVALPIERVRLLYCYPDRITNELIDYMDAEPKIAKYIDMPMQHAADTVLKRMNRKDTARLLRDRIAYIRSKPSRIAIRSTFMVGFPQETEEEFNKLVDFLREQRLDHVGFFAYSREEGTPAARMRDQVPYEVKRHRLSVVTSVQSEIMKEQYARLIGTVMDVTMDGIAYDRGCFYGHSERFAPEVDGVIYFDSSDPVLEGETYAVRIGAMKNADLYGVVEGSEE